MFDYPTNSENKKIESNRLWWEIMLTEGFPPIVFVRKQSVKFKAKLTLGQVAALHQIVQNHVPEAKFFSSNYKAAEYDERGRLDSVTFYQSFDGTNLTEKAMLIDYVYDGIELDYVSVVEYYIDGVTKNQERIEYTTQYTTTALGIRTTRISEITEDT